jgi:hypothetical protein
LFSPEELKLFFKNDFMKIDKNEFLMVLKYGLITGQLGSEKLIHKTIAEFFTLLYFIRRLNQEEFFLFFVRVVLIEKRFQVIQKMFDSYLKNPVQKSDFRSQLITNFSSTSSSKFHFLVDSGLQKSSMIEFLDFLKVHFGFEFVWEILKLKNNEGLTFWSHAFANKNISSLKEMKFGSFLEEILNKLCEMKIDFENLKKLASDLIFGRENFERNFHEELFRIGVLEKVDGKVKFSDPSSLNYFALEEFDKFLKKIHQNEKTFEFCGKLWSDRNNFSELCWLIEKFFTRNLKATKKDLDYFAERGEKNKAAFFLCLDILIIELKTRKNLLFEQGEDKTTFLHKFCEYDFRWSEESVKKIFNKLKEMKKFLAEKDFKYFLKLPDRFSGRTLLQLIESFKKFEIAFDFLCSEFGLDFVRDFFLLSGKKLLCIQESISEFTKSLYLFKNNFGKEFVKTFLMQKGWKNENFLLCFSDYSKPENCSDLLKLFDFIFSIFGADLELFKDLFYSRSSWDNQTFFEKLKEKYKKENKKFESITDWIEKNLGHDFLKK